jgi:hypothetical protein
MATPIQVSQANTTQATNISIKQEPGTENTNQSTQVN